MSLPRTLITSLALALVTAAPAAADTALSSNWAGYAAHRQGVRFSTVTAAWVQPTVSCVPGRPTYSAMWVGLGGFSVTSNALEQVGTEADCKSSGRPSSSAWYELVPAPSRPIRMSVHSGDVIFATVTVTGHRAALGLHDATRHRSFHKSVDARAVDVSSAEWILEAPSNCTSPTSCQTLPLADFGSAGFALARTRSSGHTGTISDRAWDSTRIELTPSGRRYVVDGSGTSAGTATPSSLAAGGSAFSVTFASVAVARNALFGSWLLTQQAGYRMHGR